MSKTVLIVAVLSIGLFSIDASAQDGRPLGLVIAGGPASVGLEWRLNDRFSIRPDVSVSWDSSTVTTGATASVPLGSAPVFSQTITTISSDDVLNIGVAALVTVKTWDRLQAYIAPRAGLSRASSHVQSDADAVTVNFGGTSQVIIPARHVDHHSADAGWSGRASFGVRYALSDRFSLFGETGVEYSSDPSPSLAAFSESSLPTPTITRHAVSMRSSLGVVWFF